MPSYFFRLWTPTAQRLQGRDILDTKFWTYMSVYFPIVVVSGLEQDHPPTVLNIKDAGNSRSE